MDALNPPAPAAAAAVEPVNILIVDDEPRNLAVLETILEHPGYRLVRAGSGEDALLALMREEFAVLVLDVRMPGLSGFEVAQLVKERRKTARIPIIFLSAYYNEDQHILEGYVSGAVDYLHKPVNPSILRSKVGVFAELHRKERELAAANRLLLDEVAERRDAQARLNDLAQTLERRVRERTHELEASEALLREAARRKDEFLATLAHELRNPLAPVRNAIELLKRDPGARERVDWATQLVDRQVGTLARLIDDLMDVSRINQGRFELRREPVALGEVIADAVETVRPQIDAAGQQLSVRLPDPSVRLRADRTRLAQAFTNLLHNATKYTDAGGRIALDVVVEDGAALVTVRDSGIGIPADRLASVFEMFTQVETALSRSRGGLGIGLSLTLRLVQMHGGSVQALSDGPGQGSSFEVRLPLLRADEPGAGEDAADAAAPAAAAQPPLRVLVADDNADAADTLRALLEHLGHQVRCVYDGEAAVATALQEPPDLAILDIGMPGLDGHEACRRIRQAARVPYLVALTGWGQASDLQRSQQAGFDRHLVKPVDAGALDALLAATPRRGAGHAEPGA